MSNADPGLDIPENADIVGKSSAESSVPSQLARERLKQGLASGLTLYEYILLASLVIVTIATIKMYLNATEYGNFPFSFPWNTADVKFGGS